MEEARVRHRRFFMYVGDRILFYDQTWLEKTNVKSLLTGSASSAIMAFFLLPFLYEVAGVHPFTVGALLLLSRCWDAVTDPIVGRLSDLTLTRWGRRRPWLMVAAIPLAISYFFLWQVIPGAGQFLDFVYYLFWLVLYNTFYTCISVPHLALIPEMTDDDKEQTQLTSYKIVTLVLAALFGTTLHGLFLRAIPDLRTAYAVSAGIFAFIFIFPPILTALLCKEDAGAARRLAAGENAPVQPTFLNGMKVAVSNRPFVLLCGAFVGAYMGTQFLVAHFYLYVQFVLNAEEHIIVLIFLLQCVIAIAVVVWQQLSRKILTKKTIFFIGTACCILCALGLLVVRHVIWLYPGCLILGTGIGAIFLIPFAMVPEIIDRDERKVHCRREGIYYGLFVFLQKMATSVGLAIGSIALGVAGLDAQTAEDRDDVTLAVILVLRFMVGLLPALLYASSIIPMILYPYGKSNYRLSQDRGAYLSEQIESGDYRPPEIVLENLDDFASGKSDDVLG